jgi:hypothetical protein
MSEVHSFQVRTSLLTRSDVQVVCYVADREALFTVVHPYMIHPISLDGSQMFRDVYE